MTAPTLALPKQRQPSIVAALVLIAAGIVFMLANAGYIVGLRWSDVAELWPILLVLAGVDLLLRPRSFAVAVATEIAIIGIAIVWLLSGLALTPNTSGSYETVVPRAAVSDLSITVNYGAGRLDLRGGGSDLVAVTSTLQDVTRTVSQNGDTAGVVVSSRSDFFGWRGGDRAWQVTLPSDVPTAMTLNLGAGDFDVDLTDVMLTRATINTGASSLVVRMPKPTGDLRMTISTGAASVTIDVPDGVEYSIHHTGAFQSVRGRAPTESAGYASASDRLTLTLTGAMSSVSIR